MKDKDTGRRAPARQSAPRHRPGARSAGQPDPAQRLRVVVIVTPAELEDDHPVARKARDNELLSPLRRTRLTPEELAQLHSAEDEHFGRVVEFARRSRLEVVEVSRTRHDVVLEGSVADLNEAFGVTLEHFEHAGGTYRSYQGEVHVPEELEDVVDGVLGLSSVPVGRHLSTPTSGSGQAIQGGPVRVTEIARHYHFPEGLTGKGQRIAILAFGGGYHERDLADFLRQVRPRHRGSITPISVLGASNDPLEYGKLQSFVRDMTRPDSSFEALQKKYGDDFTGALATIEATMDIEIVAAVAPEADIDVYFAPNEPQGFYMAVHAALGSVDAETGGMAHPGSHTPPTVISVSWGASEPTWGEGYMRLMNRALAHAKSRDIPVCCASGDLGSWCEFHPPDEEDHRVRVSFPASSPHALAIGGTTLRPSGDVVWNATWQGVSMATGGGLSGYFTAPTYQAPITAPSLPHDELWLSGSRESASFRGRAVPDVAASADARAGYEILVGGVVTAGGGTSASTPLWAGLLALLSESLGQPVGWINALLYQPQLGDAFRPVEEGDNDVTGGQVAYFRASPGWNACTGLGTPIGKRLLDLLARYE